jgi:hypothetical protein
MIGINNRECRKRRAELIMIGSYSRIGQEERKKERILLINEAKQLIIDYSFSF